jgi:HEPN domain-containing protein
MKKQVEEWYYFADQDMLAVSELIDNPNLTNIAAFHCQQAIEKYLKAFMVAHDIAIIKVHDLIKLYDIVKEINDFGFDLDLLDALTKLYTDDRYPGSGIGLLPDGIPTDEDAKRFYEFAKEVEQKIKAELKDGE